MSVKLPADVYSPDQVGIALWELGRLIGRLRDETTRKTVTGKDGADKEAHVSEFLLSVLHAAKTPADDYQALEKLQTELQTIRAKAPVAHVLLSALPNRTLKRELVEWCRTNLHPDLLMTFATRGDMGGGFILRVGSKQYDFTYRTRLLEDRHRLTEIFDHVR